METSTGPDGPEYDSEKASEVLTPRFPRRLRCGSSGSCNEAKDVHIDLPEPSWTALLEGLAERIKAGDVMVRGALLTCGEPICLI